MFGYVDNGVGAIALGRVMANAIAADEFGVLQQNLYMWDIRWYFCLT